MGSGAGCAGCSIVYFEGRRSDARAGSLVLAEVGPSFQASSVNLKLTSTEHRITYTSALGTCNNKGY